MRIYVAGPYTAKRWACDGCTHRGIPPYDIDGWWCHNTRIEPPKGALLGTLHGPPLPGCNEPLDKQRDANVRAADEAGRAIARRGHTPFVPHKMTYDWERDPVLRYEDFIRIDDEWLRFCDAILYIGPSKGADRELELARAMGLKVFMSVEEVPEAE